MRSLHLFIVSQVEFDHVYSRSTNGQATKDSENVWFLILGQKTKPHWI